MVRHIRQRHRVLYEDTSTFQQENIKTKAEFRANRAWIKKYMITVGEKHYKCTVCQRVLQMPKGLYGNMKRHFYTKHRNIFNLEAKLRELNRKSTENEEESNISEISVAEVEESLDEKISHKSEDNSRSNYIWLKKYMINVSERNYKCAVCKRILHMSKGWYSNMKRHFHSKHRYIFDMENKRWESHIQNDDNEVDEYNISETSAVEMEKSPNEKGSHKSEDNSRSNRVWVKKYMINVGERQYKCSVCQKILHMSKGWYCNMKRHFRTKHRNIFDKENKCWESHVQSDENEMDGPNISEKSVAEYQETAEEYQDIEELQENDEQSNGIQSENENDVNASAEATNVQCSELDDLAFQNVVYLDAEFNNDLGEIDYLSKADPDFETKIKFLAERAVPGKKKLKTCIWNFYNPIEENRLYRCLFCLKDIAIFPQSSSNLKRHIILTHKEQFQMIVKYAPEFEHERNVTKLSKIQKPAKTDDFTKSFEKSYFNEEGDDKYKCKSCNQVIKCRDNDTLELFKHIHKNHSGEIISNMEDSNDDDEEFSVLFVKKKDLEIM